MLLSRYERMIARRYLLPGKGERFIVLVAGFSLGAVMLGVAALVIVMSVMNGFRAELFDKITGLNGHAVIQGVARGHTVVERCQRSIKETFFNAAIRTMSKAVLGLCRRQKSDTQNKACNQTVKHICFHGGTYFLNVL